MSCYFCDRGKENVLPPLLYMVILEVPFPRQHISRRLKPYWICSSPLLLLFFHFSPHLHFPSRVPFSTSASLPPGYCIRYSLIPRGEDFQYPGPTLIAPRIFLPSLCSFAQSTIFTWRYFVVMCINLRFCNCGILCEVNWTHFPYPDTPSQTPSSVFT